LKTLVIASGLTSASKNIPALDHNQFWRTAFSVAKIARILAKLARQDGEVAFTCGLLHNIGDTLLFLVHTNHMAHIAALASATGMSKSVLEQSQFGCTYMEVGAELARRWKFPEEICQAIANQERPENTNGDFTYPWLLNLATRIYNALSSDESVEEAVGNIPPEHFANLNIDTNRLIDELHYLQQQEDDIESFLD
jgi:putative nucleotidyltransferase with HDIG domain